ncbi:hypothetical protein A2U01_0090335, partial [Trifolium medium]|nr:hypothetical protein [Trifolium medium]
MAGFEATRNKNLTSVQQSTLQILDTILELVISPVINEESPQNAID